MESNNMQNTVNGNDFVSMLVKIWKNRAAILKVALAGMAVGLLIFLSLPKTYVAKTSFAPETEQHLGAGVSSIASMMGVSFDSSVDAISIDMFPYVVSSRPFVFDLFELPVETKDGLQTTLLDYMKNHHKKPWWQHVMSAPSKCVGLVKKWMSKDKAKGPKAELNVNNLPGKERWVIGYFAQNLIVLMDKKTGRIDLSLEMQDPLVAATVLEAVVENLKDYMVDYRTTKEREDIKNLEVIYENRKLDYYKAQEAYSKFADANKNLVKNTAQAEQLKLQQEMNLAYQVYTQVATQLEAARIKEQHSKPVFVILEPVAIPNRPSGPGALPLMVLFAILAGFGALVWTLWGKDLYIKFVNSL